MKNGNNESEERHKVRTIFIINPAAGKGSDLDKLEARINSKSAELGISAEIYYTKSVGDAERFVRETCAASEEEKLRFYACGGDGTVNEVFNGAAGFKLVEIGIIPIGTGNDFIRNFGEREWFLDIEAQLEGDAIDLDCMKLGDRYAVNLVNLGFDCAVVETVANIKRKSWIPSKMAYIAGVLVEFSKMPGAKIKSLTVDGKKIEKSDLQLCAFANGGFYGGGFHCAPLAQINDGIMDICIVNRVSRIQFATMIGQYKSGTYLESKRIMKLAEYHKCRKACIEFEGETAFCIDGEIHRGMGLDIELVPSAFRLVLPKR